MIVKEQTRQFRFHWMWYLAPLLMVFGLCAAMFWGGGGHYWGPLESDLTNQFYPWRVFTHRWFSRGVFPYWDPHIFSGYPTVESQQMLNLNPLHLLSVFLDPKIGLTAYTALNTLVACVGMMWGLRRWGGCSAMAAALGGGLYVFGALFAVRVMAGHITVVAALAWWPLAGLSVLRVVRYLPAGRGGSAIAREMAGLSGAWRRIWQDKTLRRLVAVSALAHAMVCLAGAPQYIVYLFYIDIAILTAAARRWTWSAALAVLAGIWVLGLVLSAPQWLPALWYLPYTGRGLSSSGTTGLAFGPMRNFWLELVMPWPFGDDLNYAHLHFKNVWETATYPGGVALVLTFGLMVRVAAWRIMGLVNRKRLVAPLTPLAMAAFVILVLGFYMMIGGWLPGFGGFREPLKARALLAFGFALASAAVLDQGILRRPMWMRSLWGGVIIMGLLLGYAGEYTGIESYRALVEGFGQPMDPLASRDYQQFLTDPSDWVLRYYRAFVAGTLGAYIIILLLIVKRPRRWVAAVFLFWVALADPLFHHTRAWVARHPWSRAGLPAPVEEYFAPKLQAGAYELPWRVVLHPAIINRTHHLEGFYEYYGYDPLMPAYAVGRMLVKGVKPGENPDKAALRLELLNRVGVRFDAKAWLPTDGVTTQSEIIEVPGGSLFAVTRNVVAGSPGLARFGPDLSGTHYVVPASAAELANEEPTVAVKFRERIGELFPSDRAGTTTAALLAGESVALLNTGRPDECGIKVTLTRPALVVYKGTWLPGWRVNIDGADAGQALFANNWMAAAIVPAGEHKVVFRYRPVTWWGSLLICGLGLAGLGLLVFMPNLMRKRHEVNGI